jgi:HD superfamily phosphohydrolase
MQIIKLHLNKGGHQPKDHQEHVALAAALVHDLGHGMFSHAFEDIGRKLQLKMAEHTHVSELLIRSGEVSEVFKKEMGSGFADDVADVIKRDRPGNLYDAVVSSQFDADRLDYMQRDRLMTGLQNSGIDFIRLMANFEIAKISTGVDQESVGEIETFILGPKAYYAAETYILALFQLYPTVYFHKTTRAAEKLFSVLMLRIVSLVRDGHQGKIALPVRHPFIQFAKDPETLDNALALDDAVFWGALSMLAESQDKQISFCAKRLRDRKLPRSIDIRNRLISEIGLDKASDLSGRAEKKERLERLIASIKKRLQAWAENESHGTTPRILIDQAVRDPYRRFQESKGPLNQIHIRVGNDSILDVAECSSVLAAVEKFELFRAYVDREDAVAEERVDKIVSEELSRGN